MGNGVASELSYDGSGEIYRYLVSGPFGLGYNLLTDQILVNDQGHTYGQMSGINSNDAPTTGSGGFARIDYYDYDPPSQPEGYVYTTADVFPYGYSSPISYTSIQLSIAASDQSGNFIHAWAVSGYGHFQVGIWPGDAAAPAPIWKVSRLIAGTDMMDTTFSSGQQLVFEIGNNTSFDPNGMPVPMETIIQHDGKVVVVGKCKVDDVERIVFARYHNIPDPRAKLSLRVILGGAFEPGAGLMRDDLRQQGQLPTLQPYTAPAYSAVNGVGSWAMPQEVMSWSGDSAVVDWVWLELLQPSDSTTVAATRVGLVHRNGQVTQADGRSPIDFSAGAGSYLLRVRHRNHLSVTTATPITLGAGVTSLDLTDPATATFGTEAQMELNGVRMLWPGDAHGDDVVKYVGAANDRDAILMAIGGSTPTATLSGYHPADTNLDGVVKYVGPSNDRDLILQTIGGYVPTAVRVAQHP
jgi:hypothetical protein